MKATFPDHPTCPNSARALPGYNTLAEVRDALTEGFIDKDIERRIQSVISSWKAGAVNAAPYSDLKEILDSIRQVRPSPERVALMNTVVRTLGGRDSLATYLDILRDVASRDGSQEQIACKSVLQNGRMHSVYGWCGNTLLCDTPAFPASGTHAPGPGVEEKLGFSSGLWNLTLHIWQPTKAAKGFSMETLEEGILVEPPHSHPFDFVSYIVTGSVHQSMYVQEQENASGSSTVESRGRYDDVDLEHVDGVWPPHDYRKTCRLITKEHRVELVEGNSYYMPCEWIHDVEIDRRTIYSKPAISLFLSSESIVMPHVYMLRKMADYHEANLNVKQSGRALTEEAWHSKLSAISAYLRGEAPLDLDPVVNHVGDYAFFNIKG